MPKLLKAALSFALVYLLWRKGLVSLGATRQAFRQPEKLFLALLMFGFRFLLGVQRWQLLLKAQGVVLKWSRVFQLSFIADFFNIAVPGGVTGDFVRAYYVSLETGQPKAKLFGITLFDRISGLSALIILAAISNFATLSFDNPFFKSVQIFTALMAVSTFGFYAFQFWINPERDPIRKVLNRVSIPGLSPIRRVYESFREFRKVPAASLGAVAISIGVHFLGCLACYFIFQSIDNTQVNPVAAVSLVSIGLFVTSIPLAPAGIGTGHAAFSWLFLLMGSKMGANVFNLYLLYQVILSLVGGLFYLQFRGHNPAFVPDRPVRAGV